MAAQFTASKAAMSRIMFNFGYEVRNRNGESSVHCTSFYTFPGIDLLFSFSYLIITTN